MKEKKVKITVKKPLVTDGVLKLSMAGIIKGPIPPKGIFIEKIEIYAKHLPVVNPNPLKVKKAIAKAAKKPAIKATAKKVVLKKADAKKTVAKPAIAKKVVAKKTVVKAPVAAKKIVKKK